MARGKKAKIGDTRTSPNGYHYTRTSEGWILTHRITAERKLGRRLTSTERIRFLDGNRRNFSDPNNIDVYQVRKGSDAKRRARIEARIESLQAELAELEDLEN
jgi:hypothetical protein